jgi:hypothetical protein
VNFADLFLINAHNGITTKNIPPVDIRKYPAIKNHLDFYWNKIKNREDQGNTPYNLRSCAYMDEFSKQKIFYREISDNMNACYSDSEIFTNNKAYLITGKNLLFLLGVFNSKLFNKIILQNVNITGGKGAGFLNPINVPFPSNAGEIMGLVSKRINEKSENEIEKLDNEIDVLICKMYGLNDEEIKYLQE